MTRLRQWALGYLAVAWLVVQVIDVLGDSWDLEASIEQGIQLALGFGLFLVLALAVFLHRHSTPASPHVGGRYKVALSLGGWAIASLLLASLGFTIWSSGQSAYARAQLIPEAERLAGEGQYLAALEVLERAERFVPGDELLAAAFESSSVVLDIDSNPTDADVFVKEYSADDDAWRHVGRTPITNLRIPLGHKVWRIEKTGYEPVIRAPPILDSFAVELDVAGTWPDGMVRVPSQPTQGWTAETGANLVLSLPDFYYDRYEVTNRAFEQFVAAGGYRDASLWEEMRAVTDWAATRERFVDATGRLGPASWELGAPRAGEEDLPVSGVSWYEALAYCRFHGKTLPTLYHWSGSSGVFATASDVAAKSNFSSDGPIRGNASTSIGSFGALDLVGNVREWIWNEAGDGRLILGGAWNDPAYLLSHAQTFDAMDRSQGNGFRCVLDNEATDDRPLTLAPVELNARDYYTETPVSDDVFEFFKQQFAYDETPLGASIEETGVTPDGFSYEVVTIAPTYDGSNVRALLILPNDVARPHQAVVVFPGSYALIDTSIHVFTTPGPFSAHYIARSGRVLVIPEIKGTYSRQDGLQSTWPSETKRYSEYAIRWVQDFSRLLDYLETRPDIDADAIAYLGFSWGGRMGPLVLAVEERFKVGILESGGLASGKALPEVDQINFVTRVHVPVLMLNGLRDSIEPYETAQKPLFDLLGTPAQDKRHVTFEDVGHLMPRTPVVRETIDWLDRNLGVADSR